MIVNELNGQQHIATITFLVGAITLTPVINQVIRRFLIAKTHQIKIDRVYGTVGNSLSLIDRLNNILAAALSLVAIFSIIATINVLIIAIALGIIFINSLITRRLNQKQHISSKALSRFDHFFNGFMLVLHPVMYAKEVRLFHLKEYFSDIIMEKKTEACNS